MISYLMVAFGGALGAMSRYWVYNAHLEWNDGRFPSATLLVNIVGSFLIGIAYVLIIEKAHLGPSWRAVVMVGFLGAFTTFSTFSMDAVELLLEGQLLAALVYVLSSVVVCIVMAWLGLTLFRLLV
ncbi:MAG: fluoride efflux transporter CrcB [Pseudomonadales bacterium]|nr:fluoride efflux transporter CrcB [Pseudomonadales bacterium]